jgi:uncharacterized protein YecE (DUF72 family)
VNIYLGTSGYKFDDWVGSFYPSNIRKPDMLDYYVNHFNLIELTFTYYKIPSYGEIKNIFDRSRENTYYTIRLPHFFQKNRFGDEDTKNLLLGLSPILESKRLFAFFVDFPYRFYACKKNLEFILYLKKTFIEYPFFVELPNRTWYKERFIQEFKTNNIGMISLDLPLVVGLAPFYLSSFNSKAYVRLYGRSNLWLTPETKELNYDYKSDELKGLSEEIRKITESADVAVSFCNVVDGYAPKNALEFKKIIGMI